MSGYDEWKLAYPSVYDWPACEECSRELYHNDSGEWLCEDCENPSLEPPQQDEHAALDRMALITDERQCADCGYPVNARAVFLGGCWFCETCNPAIP